uniref:G-protein coupled receptors family 1 profile domain-containing protein n=1 Tax=Trichuris muris TaxID=70415 RepID=A0A5S6R1W8_TRIMR
MNHSILGNTAPTFLINKQEIIFSQFAQVCHVVRAAVGYSALLSTLYYLALFVKHRRLRTTLNWAVCNLLVSNGLLAIVIAIFSTLKAINPNSLSSLRGCLSFTWVITFLSFGPSWSVALMALTRAVHYSNVPTLDQVLSLRTLGMLRTFTVLLDAIMTSLILHRKAALVAPTHCTYQLMLEASDVHMIYTLVIILLLVAAGLSALSLRIRRRRQMLANRDIPNPSSTGSAEKPVHQSVPVNIFKKPMMMSTGVLLVSLFALPRVAFFVDCTELWQISTLCPVVDPQVIPVALRFPQINEHSGAIVTFPFARVQAQCFTNVLRINLSQSEELLLAPLRRL